MSEQLNYIEKTLTQTATDIKALAKDVRNILVHQKALNGSVGENTRSIARLAEVMNNCETRNAQEFRAVKKHLCTHGDILDKHDREIVRLSERTEYQTREHEQAQEQLDWTRTQLFETATRVAGLVAKLTAIGGIVYFLLNNLP